MIFLIFKFNARKRK